MIMMGVVPWGSQKCTNMLTLVARLWSCSLFSTSLSHGHSHIQERLTDKILILLLNDKLKWITEVQRESFPCRQSQARGFKKAMFIMQSDRPFKNGGDRSQKANKLKT